MQPRFISITDFTDREQVEQMLKITEKHNQEFPSNKKLLLGVGIMMSYKTLNGFKSKLTDIFPKKEMIASIFINHPLVFNVLHYADYKEKDFLNSIFEAVTWGSHNLNAIQLDMIWPNAKSLKKFRNAYPDIKIILQIGADAFTMVENDPMHLIRTIKDYSDSIEYLLLDKSMGKGKTLDSQFLIPFVEVLSKERPDLGIVVAGGLGPYTLDLIDPIITEYPDISIDAQGRLRPSKSYFDPIDWNYAGQYLEKAYQKFNK